MTRNILRESADTVRAWQNQTKVLRDITLAKGDSLTVCVIHNMRDDGIKGVAAVGVTIRKKDTAK